MGQILDNKNYIVILQNNRELRPTGIYGELRSGQESGVRGQEC